MVVTLKAPSAETDEFVREYLRDIYQKNVTDLNKCGLDVNKWGTVAMGSTWGTGIECVAHHMWRFASRIGRSGYADIGCPEGGGIVVRLGERGKALMDELFGCPPNFAGGGDIYPVVQVGWLPDLLITHERRWKLTIFSQMLNDETPY